VFILPHGDDGAIVIQGDRITGLIIGGGSLDISSSLLPV
jgi:hypothetical protein